MILRPGALGDTLMLLPAIDQLRAYTELVLVGRYPGLEYLRPYVDICMDFEGQGWHRLFMENPGIDHGLSLPELNRVIVFFKDPEDVVRRNLEGLIPGTPIHLFPPYPQKGEKVHAALHLARSLKHAGLPIDPDGCMEAARNRPLLNRDLPPGKDGQIVLHPGSGGPSKNYPPGLWIKMIRALKKAIPSKGDGPVLLLGPAEQGLQSSFRKGLNKEEVKILFCPERERLLKTLAKAVLYVGHDSGITHLAAMLGTPTIVLFRNSPMLQWHPIGPAVEVIGGEKDEPDLIEEILQKGRRLLKRS